MFTSTDEVSLTFRLPDPRSSRSLQITLKPWSEGLKPWNLEEFLFVSGEAIKDHFHQLWKYPLDDMRRQIDPTQWALWLADIPDDLLVELRHHGLLQVGALYLIRQFPDMRQALSVGPFFLALLERWINDARDDGIAFANEQLQRKLSLRRTVALRKTSFLETMHMPASPLRMRFLSFLPASYCFRGHPERKVAFHNYDDFLPQFFSTRRRFKEKLHILQAFHWACLSASIPFEDAIPLFGKALRQRARVRSANLTKLFIRLEAIHRRLCKGKITGLLKGAPSIRFLENYLRRQERTFQKRRSLGLLPVEPDEFPVPQLREIPCLEPLLNLTALRQEGSYMRNCIATYANQLELGTHAAYRMRWPERGTVLLQYDKNGQWQVEDARIEHDVDMGEDGMSFLKAWLTERPLIALPENLPPYYPEAFFDDSPYPSPHPDQWDDMPFDVDNLWAIEGEWEEGDIYDLETEAGPDSDDSPASGLSSRLPDKVAGWTRINCTGQLEEGVDRDMLTPSYLALIQDPATVIYIHPHFTLGYVAIHQSGDPAHSMEIIRHHNDHKQGMTFKGLQLVEALRQAFVGR